MRNRLILIALSIVVAVIGVVIVVSAGNPDIPPGPPETTYSYTLEDVYQRLATGASITQSTFTEPSDGPPTGTMHTLDEIVAMIPYGGCRCEGTLNGTRWCDNLDGTVTDLTTCLVWMKNTVCTNTVAGIVKSSGTLSWTNAMIWSDGVASGTCGLSDGSVSGDWWLPTSTQLLQISQGTEPVRQTTPRAFTDVQNDYWSSTIHPSVLSYAGDVNLGVFVNYIPMANPSRVWPVRCGQ